MQSQTPTIPTIAEREQKTPPSLKLPEDQSQWYSRDPDQHLTEIPEEAGEGKVYEYCVANGLPPVVRKYRVTPFFRGRMYDFTFVCWAVDPQEAKRFCIATVGIPNDMVQLFRFEVVCESEG